MDRKNRLNFCRTCAHKKDDMDKGIICGLTNDYPTFDFDCVDYKESKILQRKEGEKDFKRNSIKKRKKKKVNTNIYIVLFLINIVVIYGVYNFTQKVKKKQELYQKQSRSVGTKSNTEVSEQKPKPLKIKQPKAVQYFASDKRLAIKRKRVNRDTSFMVAKKLKVIMHKRYYMSIVKDDETPVLSISRGYSFVYNKVTIDPSKSVIEQWVDYRKNYAEDFEYKVIKDYTFSGLDIKDINFTYNGKRDVYGAAKIIEAEGFRHFFHFSFKQPEKDYKELNRYLNYYVKVE